MNVLAVVPDGNVMDRLRWAAKFNELNWHVITIRPNADIEPDDWCQSVTHLDIDDRHIVESPPVEFPYLPFCQYEIACHSFRSPFIINWLEYHRDEIERGLTELETCFRGQHGIDVVVTCGERGWYNELVIATAQRMGIPVCRLERATFPGMFVADGTGLEQGRCDLPYWYNELETMLDCHNKHIWSVAPWQNIEQQERTTIGMVKQLLDSRPALFVPLQVPFDTNLVFRANEYTNFDMLEYVAREYPNHRVLVKQHPSDKFSDAHNIAAYCADHGWEYVTWNSHAIIQAVDQMVSINSQCIIEAWMHQTPVDVLGNPAFDIPEEPLKDWLLYALRYLYYIEPWQLTSRLEWICQK